MRESVKAFNELVLLKYQVYNSIFLTLDLDGVHRTGILIPLLQDRCTEGFEAGKRPDEIIEQFFEEQGASKIEKNRLDELFRFIQFIERQIVLVDALEDAAFAQVNRLDGNGSFTSFYTHAENRNALEQLRDALAFFRVRIVLTAHPTQFYPGPVLGIITDLSEAIKVNDLPTIKTLLAQLGKTPFFKKTKPTPYDEAVSLIWYLENVFYHAIPEIYRRVVEKLGPDAGEVLSKNALLQLGFWPGGDRDGNPFVDTNTTLKVADRLRTSLFKSYFRDIRVLKRRLTFKGVQELIAEIEQKIYNAAFVDPNHPRLTLTWLQNKLDALIKLLRDEHNGLFEQDVVALRTKVKIFGFHFGSIDIRQDSRVIRSTFEALSEKVPALRKLTTENGLDGYMSLEALKKQPKLEDPVQNDTFSSLYAMQEIQKRNGSLGAYRYIISNCRDQFDVARVFAMAKLAGMGDRMYIDIIPLFETIDDLRIAGAVMSTLYEDKYYRRHLRFRKDKQVVMLGFSDGTKDGGYIAANWNIYCAKENISAISRAYGIRVVFFDGRGGPPARGGGNTHKFYASLGPAIDSSQIQITIQGQTISSNFGTPESARYNLEQLLTAGLENQVLSDPEKVLSDAERHIMEELSEMSYTAYQVFKANPSFVPFLEKMTTLKYYGETNIGSRPSKRGKGSALKFEDLRAIPFVGAWSQLKQNVPGFYGLGTAFEIFDNKGRIDELKALYKSSLFFRTLLENSMQSLSKSYFPLTAYMEKDKEFGPFWRDIHNESIRAKKYLLEISGQQTLLELNPTIKESIQLREKIVLPLLTIQQHALIQIKKLEAEGKAQSATAMAYRKLVVRSLYGNINASRNSA